MSRLLICLPICLLLSPQSPNIITADEPTVTAVAAQDRLPVKDPLDFMKMCLDRYEKKGIQGYSATLQKQERIDDKLQPSEEISVFVREKPFSVYMHWVRGQRRADNVLYVQGQNENKLLIHPSGLAGALVKVVSRDPEGEDARQAGRYSLKEFGLKKAMERAFKDWTAFREEGTLKIEYLGIRKVREAGDRPCYTIRRTALAPAKDGIAEVTLYIDKETWLQVGTVIKGDENKLLGEYMFRDVQLDPKFKANQFEPSAVAPTTSANPRS